MQDSSPKKGTTGQSSELINAMQPSDHESDANLGWEIFDCSGRVYLFGDRKISLKMTNFFTLLNVGSKKSFWVGSKNTWFKVRPAPFLKVRSKLDLSHGITHLSYCSRIMKSG